MRAHLIPPPRALLRLADVLARTGLSRSELYRRMASGAFPRSLALGRRARAWDSSQVDDWISSVAAGRAWRARP